MNFNEYQKQAFTTATAESQNIYYMTLGLTGEAGEISNKVKKVMRDGKQLDLEDIKHELGDVLWYVAGLATLLNISLEDVADSNIHKLASRKARGVIGGSGDNR
jgi:NTP pyrophosphatase (non-canonical NTP hydrolase)